MTDDVSAFIENMKGVIDSIFADSLLLTLEIGTMRDNEGKKLIKMTLAAQYHRRHDVLVIHY